MLEATQAREIIDAVAVEVTDEQSVGGRRCSRKTVLLGKSTIGSTQENTVEGTLAVGKESIAPGRYQIRQTITVKVPFVKEKPVG